MQADRPRAVAACLPAGGGEAARLLGEAGFALAATAETVGEAMRRVDECQPGLLLADAVLPGGDGVALARRIDAAALNVYPCIVLLRPAGLRLPGEASLAAMNAAALDRPASAKALLDAVESLRSRAPALSGARAQRLSALMDDMGIPAHPGRDMLSAAVALAWRDRRRLHNLRDEIYPAAGRPFGRTAAQAERAIRHVIDAAWRTGEIDRQQAIFGDTIDARRGRPTCGEMIAQLADILRWEG